RSSAWSRTTCPRRSSPAASPWATRSTCPCRRASSPLPRNPSRSVKQKRARPEREKRPGRARFVASALRGALLDEHVLLPLARAPAVGHQLAADPFVRHEREEDRVDAQVEDLRQ